MKISKNKWGITDMFCYPPDESNETVDIESIINPEVLDIVEVRLLEELAKPLVLTHEEFEEFERATSLSAE